MKNEDTKAIGKYVHGVWLMEDGYEITTSIHLRNHFKKHFEDSVNPESDDWKEVRNTDKWPKNDN